MPRCEIRKDGKSGGPISGFQVSNGMWLGQCVGNWMCPCVTLEVVTKLGG